MDENRPSRGRASRRGRAKLVLATPGEMLTPRVVGRTAVVRRLDAPPPDQGVSGPAGQRLVAAAAVRRDHRPGRSRSGVSGPAVQLVVICDPSWTLAAARRPHERFHPGGPPGERPGLPEVGAARTAQSLRPCLPADRQPLRQPRVSTAVFVRMYCVPDSPASPPPHHRPALFVARLRRSTAAC